MTSRRCTTTPADLDSPPNVSCAITLDEEELRQLLNERDHLRKQVTELQVRNTELIEAERELKRLRYQIELNGKFGLNLPVQVLPPVVAPSPQQPDGPTVPPPENIVYCEKP